MPELKGKLETTYCWTCEMCNTENARLDDQHCAVCAKQRGDEKVIRHFKLIPTPMKLGWVM